MDEGNYISANLDEGYSPEAIANMENALEDFAVSLIGIKPEDANIGVFRGLKAKQAIHYDSNKWHSLSA